MAKDFLTPKEIAKRLKAKGLQKLRWYCQMCQKQCRDENGFKCHCTTEAHQRQMQLFNERPGSYLSTYSKIFLDDFLRLLSRRFGTKRVFANRVYQEFISDRQHQHMNSTRWQSLTEFVTYLGREGLAEVDETERGWYIKWIDKSPSTLAKQDGVKRRECMKRARMEEEDAFRAKVDGAQKAFLHADADESSKPSELVRSDSDAPIKISLMPARPTSSKVHPASSKANFLEKAKLAVSKPIQDCAALNAAGGGRLPSESSAKPKSMVEILARKGGLSQYGPKKRKVS